MSISCTDLALARRLEGAEAANGLALVRASDGRQKAEPFLGGMALFGGVGSPMTHAMGIGMQGPASREEFERMEEFFRSNGSGCLIDLCPLADFHLQKFVMSGGYQIIEFNNLMVRRVVPEDAGFTATPSLGLREVRAEEKEDWIRLILRGFLESDEVSPEMLEMMRPSAGPSRCLLAAVDGEAIGGAMMGVQQGVGLFYGDATSKEARGLGVQSALIRYRVALAARLGCDLAMASVIPGSISNRNYERAGFQLVYMRVNVKREW